MQFDPHKNCVQLGLFQSISLFLILFQKIPAILEHLSERNKKEAI